MIERKYVGVQEQMKVTIDIKSKLSESGVISILLYCIVICSVCINSYVLN